MVPATNRPPGETTGAAAYHAVFADRRDDTPAPRAGPPATLHVVPGAIPAELRERQQWVAWRYEQRDGRPTKIPISPRTAQHASVTDPATWGTFMDALAYADRHGLPGVGFVLTADDPYTVVDLDHCARVDGTLSERAREIVARLTSYAEWSPSGTGVHVWLRGAIPGERRRAADIEIYSDRRYVTVTGRHLPGTPATIEARQEALDALYREAFGEAEPAREGPVAGQSGTPLTDDQVLWLAARAKNAATFERLFFRGDTSGYPSASEADSALACALAFYTRDPQQIARLIDRSALGARDKWRERADYRERTIQHALETVTESYAPPAPRPTLNGHLPSGEESASAPTSPNGATSADRGIDRPQIEVTDRFLRDITCEALAALERANDPPWLFQRGRALVRMRTDALAAEPLDAVALKGILDRVADFVAAHLTKDGVMIVPKRPPADLAPDILSLPSRDWPFPVLRALSAAPVFLPGGRLLATDGYDPESGLLLRLDGLTGLNGGMGVTEALAWLLDELLGDFPFVDEASRAHALAALLQPFVRPLIAGPTPLYLIDAPTRGTGKGLLADIVALVAIGQPAPVMALVSDNDELDKRVTALLMDGAPVILIDNAVELRSPVLAAVLTSVVWRGRRLGRSEMREVPNHALWLATGNNVALSDEMVRRIVPIRLDTGVERPEERTGFRHPDLAGWAAEHRRELVDACLSLVQAWVEAGMPRGTATLGRYEAWAGVLGGILSVAGVPGFLSGRERLHAEADAETREWCALCAAWWEAYGARPVTAGELFTLCKERGLLLDIWGGRSALSAQQRLGHALAARRDRVFAGYTIRAADRDGATGNAAYRLERRAASDKNQGSYKTPETPETPDARGNALQIRGNSPPSPLGVFDGEPAKHPANTGKTPEAKSPEDTGDFDPPAGVFGVSGVLRRPHRAAGNWWQQPEGEVP